MGADAVCQELASAANLSGTYLAWLSDTTGSPSTRFSRDGGPYQLVDGTIIANNWSDLTTGILQRLINLTETGGMPPSSDVPCGSDFVWTGTTSAGDLDGPDLCCDDWSDYAAGAEFGSTQSFQDWSDTCGTGATSQPPICLLDAPLFCFQQ
jgi:hypothetical protein